MVAEGWVLGSRYVLRERIGGDSSSVWRANDMTGWETVAVKVLDPRDGIDQQAAGRFLGHARALSVLGHSAVVQVIDHGQDGGVLYRVTPYVLGESLRALLDRGRRLDETSAMVLLADVADGLNAAAMAGVGQTHLSLTDVILRLDGSPVLVGLGGEPNPAQLMLAAGRLGYECLTGAPPDDPANLANVDQSVRAVLTRALATDPALRFRDLPALAAAAREAVGAPQPAMATTESRSPSRAVAAVRSERPAPPGLVPAVTGTLPAVPVPVPPAATPTPTAPLPTAPVPTAPVPTAAALTAPATTAPVSAPPGRRPGSRRPILVAILVLLVLAAGTATAYQLGLWPGSGLAAGDGPSSTPDATVHLTLGEPTTRASRTPTATPTPTAAASSTAAPTAPQATASVAPPPQVFDYRLAPLELSPVVIDGSCVFQVVYGNYGLPFAELHQFDGDCGSPTFQIAAVPPTGDWAWHSTPQESGTSADCGGYSWRRVVGPEGWTAFGVQVVFPRTGNTHNYGAFGTGTPPAHRSC